MKRIRVWPQDIHAANIFTLIKIRYLGIVDICIQSRKESFIFIFAQFKAVSANYTIVRYKQYESNEKYLYVSVKSKPKYYF
jgi:hypothetical protein